MSARPQVPETTRPEAQARRRGGRGLVLETPVTGRRGRWSNPSHLMKELLSSPRRCGLLAAGSTLIPLTAGFGRPGPVPIRGHDAETAHPRPSSEAGGRGRSLDRSTTSPADETIETLHHRFGVAPQGHAPVNR